MVRTAAILAATLLLAAGAGATELTSPSFRLVSPTISGGGGVDLQSTAGSPTVHAQGVTIGQSSPIGESVGETSGIRLQAGFWPTVTGGAAGEDSDGDGVPDALDNCIDAPNGPAAGPNNQLDSDGDDIGNVCDGDFNQDLFVGGPDFDTFLQCFNMAVNENVGPVEDPNCEESDMNGDAFVGGPDFDLFLQIFNGPPGPTGL